MARRPVLVVKVGTSTLTDASGAIDRSYLESFAAQVAAVKDLGYDPIVVTSASIAAGLEALGRKERPQDTPSLQAAASVGQIFLYQAYAEVFARFGIIPSLVLLTRHDTASRRAYLHARDAFEQLLNWGVVPIVNENDTVSVEQIRFGDNDTLSALVACLVQADQAVIFTDTDGLYDKNPATHANARLLSKVSFIDRSIIEAAEGPGTKQGSGGMITKVRAARVLMTAGIPLTICNGRLPDVLPRLIGGEAIGTRFERAGLPHEITPRKLWIALGDVARGSLVVDDGARSALEAHGASLLAVGVRSVEGEFIGGDIVDIIDGDGHLFARGRINVTSDECRLAAGRSGEELASNKLLSHMAQHPLIHRDELIVFD